MPDKIIIVGNAGCGKTSFLGAVYDVYTDRKRSRYALNVEGARGFDRMLAAWTSLRRLQQWPAADPAHDQTPITMAFQVRKGQSTPRILGRRNIVMDSYEVPADGIDAGSNSFSRPLPKDGWAILQLIDDSKTGTVPAMLRQVHQEPGETGYILLFDATWHFRSRADVAGGSKELERNKSEATKAALAFLQGISRLHALPEGTPLPSRVSIAFTRSDQLTSEERKEGARQFAYRHVRPVWDYLNENFLPKRVTFEFVSVGVQTEDPGDEASGSGKYVVPDLDLEYGVTSVVDPFLDDATSLRRGGRRSGLQARGDEDFWRVL